MSKTTDATLTCPSMPINHDHLLRFVTAEETMDLETDFDDGTPHLSMQVIIPPTPVTVRPLHFFYGGVIATVAACQGKGASAQGDSFETDLPEEPVAVETVDGKIVLVAKQISAPSKLVRNGGMTFQGVFVFPDCVVSGMDASEVVAEGSLTT